ncbi:MAG: DUF192 domain-containing protein [Azoarcus sp.]|jgi:uncharacterized membrane protein (UPF0127 family)|nr:DUF192 domain-containing protein [Azoarcus sp.]
MATMTRVWLAALAAGWMNAASAQMPLARLELGGAVIDVEVATSDAEQRLGLMYRSSLASDHGMIFVHPEDTRLCMWMKNTLIPLSVAFLDGEGRILNIEDMAPQSEDSHCALSSARYALEMNKGWFSTHGIKTGDRVEGIKSLPAQK